MLLLKTIQESLLHLIYPHICAGCGSDNINIETTLCFECLSSLPETQFHLYPDNAVEKTFWGRLPIVAATAQYYFTKNSVMQRLMHQFKYKGAMEIGMFLGRQMGYSLLANNRFASIDALVPLPLFAAREKARGYNQAAILCQGIAQIIHKPVLTNAVIRKEWTETQTKKSRIERWQNMDGRFQLVNSKAIEDKHLLLVDDVITTGATLEACGHELLKAPNVKISIGALCHSSN